MSLTENKLKINGVDVATEINAKVNSTELAKVAISGSYNDLKDKPSGGSASGDYLPLSGGTIIGTVNFQGSNPIDLTDADGNLQGTILVDSTGITIKHSKKSHIGDRFLSFTSNGDTLVSNPNSLDDPSSGSILEVANVAFVYAHTKRNYLSLNGGTLTGELTVKSDIVIDTKSGDNGLLIDCPAGTNGLQGIQFISSQGTSPVLGTITVSEDTTYSKVVTQLSAGSHSTISSDTIIAGIKITSDETNGTGKVETQQPSEEEGDDEIATLKWVRDNTNNVAPVNADWNATSGLAQIKNKPTIPTVPTKLSGFTNDMGFAKIQSSTTDLTAGSSTLATGTVYLVYE